VRSAFSARKRRPGSSQERIEDTGPRGRMSTGQWCQKCLDWQSSTLRISVELLIQARRLMTARNGPIGDAVGDRRSGACGVTIRGDGIAGIKPAAPEGCLPHCSHSCNVRFETPRKRAKRSCVSPVPARAAVSSHCLAVYWFSSPRIGSGRRPFAPITSGGRLSWSSMRSRRWPST